VLRRHRRQRIRRRPRLGALGATSGGVEELTYAYDLHERIYTQPWRTAGFPRESAVEHGIRAVRYLVNQADAFGDGSMNCNEGLDEARGNLREAQERLDDGIALDAIAPLDFALNQAHMCLETVGSKRLGMAEFREFKAQYESA